jgi:hypothetical protein
MRRSSQDIPGELDDVVRRLQAHRAELTPLELDRIKLESRTRAAGRPRFTNQRENTQVMRTKTSILAVLVSGIVMSGGGVALGVSGIAGSDNASQSQYQVKPIGAHAQGPTVLGASATSPAGNSAAAPASTQGAAVAQPTAQRSLGSGSGLPFTGYAAIPVLLIGLALLGSGVVMRRRSRAERS